MIEGNKENLIGANFFKDVTLPLLLGREDIIDLILRDSFKTGESTSFTLSPNNTDEIKGSEYSWIVEVNPIEGDLDELPVLLMTFHKLTNSMRVNHKPKSIGPTNSEKKELMIQKDYLQGKVDEKDTQYRAAAEELDNFVYSVSHDLRAPLRRIDGFSQELLSGYGDQLDEIGKHYLSRIRQGTQDMGMLIDDLLKLSRISRKKIERNSFDLVPLIQVEFENQKEGEPDRDAELIIEDDELTANADVGLVKVILMNLLSNAFKFSMGRDKTVIKVGKTKRDKKTYFYISDNGVGFNPDYKDKLFKAFSRLHSQRDFSGSGIGLATVNRIIRLHGGDIFAETIPENGATFYFNFNKTGKHV